MRGRMQSLWQVALLIGLAVLIAWSVGAQEQEKEKEKFKESYSAWVLAMGTSNPPIIPAGASTTAQINVTRWTTDEERGHLLTTLAEKGHEELVKELQKQEETGWVRVTGRGANLSRFPSTRLKFAREHQEGDKRILVLATDRPIPFFEAMGNYRTRDYDISLVVLSLDKEGNGEGSLALGTKLKVNQEKKTLEIENFGTEPLRLNKVSKQN